MSDLGLQIRTYYEDVVERVDPMTPPTSTEPGWTRPALVLAVTVLFVLVGIGVVPFLVRWVAIEPAAEETTTTNASPTTLQPDPETLPTTVGPTPDAAPSPSTSIPQDAAGPPPVGRIAFVSDRDGLLGGLDRDLLVINADGTGVIHLADLYGGGDPAWSPDGTQIAFGYLVNGNTQTFVVQADGSTVKQLTSLPGAGMFYDWSPDGSQIAFNGGDRLYVMNADGSDPTRLSDLIIEQPAWSPDGSLIAFEAENGDDRDIFVITPDGSGLVRLTDRPGNHHLVTSPWSPDGRHVLVATRIAIEGSSGGRQQTETRYNLISPDGEQVEELDRAMIGDSAVVLWSPDGTRIAVVDSSGHLFVVNPDGSNVIRLTVDLLIYPGKGSVSWSPTGSHIVFSAALTYDESAANNDIYIIAVNGSGLTRLTIEPGNDIEPVWSPTP